jgi:hypothetical protein
MQAASFIADMLAETVTWCLKTSDASESSEKS